MTYADFMRGLFYKFNMIYVKSKPYIAFGGSPREEAEYVGMVTLLVDSETVLNNIENRNMAEALCLISQGYEQWEVALMIDKSPKTIAWYVMEIKRILRNFQ
jgi:hypothetical protein